MIVKIGKNFDYRMLNYPYSVTKDEYEIINYGFEHLIPQLWVEDLNRNIGIQYDLVQRGPHLFELQCDDLSRVHEVLDLYRVNEIMDVKLEGNIVSNVVPLRKLGKCKSEAVYVVLLDHLLLCLGVKYKRGHRWPYYRVLDLKEEEKALLGEGPFSVPWFHFYFNTDHQAVGHHVLGGRNQGEILRRAPAKRSFSIFTFLNCLGYKQYTLNHVRRGCPNSMDLDNPIGNVGYCMDHTRCVDPIKLGRGWCVNDNTLHIWGDPETKSYVKSVMTLAYRWVLGPRVNGVRTISGGNGEDKGWYKVRSDGFRYLITDYQSCF